VKAILILARMFVLFVSVSGFLIGQLFFGIFSISATITGVSGLLAGALSLLPTHYRLLRLLVFIFCVITLLGVGVDAVQYYVKDHMPGNYYGWSLMCPFIASLLLIAYSSIASCRNSKGRRSFYDRVG